MAYNRGLLGPWELWRKVALGLVAVLVVFLFVTVMVPLGFAALLALWLCAQVWRGFGVTDPTLGTYTINTMPFKVAAFFTALKSSWKYNPNGPPTRSATVLLGLGPPAKDGHHKLEAGFFPATRLSGYWALLAAIPLGALDILLIPLHLPFWGSFTLPWFVMFPLSVVGWFATIQAFTATRRIQGDSTSLMAIEQKPAVMLSRSNAEVPTRELLQKSLTYGAIPLVLMLVVWALVKWPLWVTLVLAPLLLLGTAAVSASRILQAAYIVGWQESNARRDNWTANFMFMRDKAPMFVNEVELPTREEYEATIDPDDPDPAPYIPQVKIATFQFPPNGVFTDYVGLEERIQGFLGVERCAITPIGIVDSMGQEQAGTVGSRGFRVWWTEQEPPSLMEREMDHWMRELLCRAIVIPALSQIRGIGDCILVNVRPVTRPESERTVMKVNLIPMRSGVTVESFLDNLAQITRVLGVQWVRAGRERSRRAGANTISLYFGQEPVQGKTRFINPQSHERKVIDEMDWSYYFNTTKLQGANGVPRMIQRRPATDVVDKILFQLPDGLPFEAIANRMSPLKSTSGYSFMEIEQGDDEDGKKMTEAQKIRAAAEAGSGAKFTIIAAKEDPLRRVFEFGDYTPQLLTGREPGKAKIDWSPGILADDQPAWDSWASADAPHLLVAGASGSGKSVVMSSMILQIAYNNSPDEARFWMVEPKTEMQVYRNLDVVERFVDSWTPDEEFYTNAADLMEDAVREMNKRNRAFISHPKQPKQLSKAREIAANESNRDGTDIRDHPLYMPFIFIILEECASLFAESASKEERAEQARLLVATAEIARKARSAGIYLIAATQYPTNASIPSVIRQQMRRIGMRCQNSLASQVVIGEPGLEAIRVKGAGKIMHRDSYRNFRGYWVKDGDPDYGEDNDIFSTIKSLPGGGGGGYSAQVSLPAIVVPSTPESIFTLWDQSKTGRAIFDAVETERRTRDKKDEDVPEMVEQPLAQA